MSASLVDKPEELRRAGVPPSSWTLMQSRCNRVIERLGGTGGETLAEEYTPSGRGSVTLRAVRDIDGMRGELETADGGYTRLTGATCTVLLRSLGQLRQVLDQDKQARDSARPGSHLPPQRDSSEAPELGAPSPPEANYDEHEEMRSFKVSRATSRGQNPGLGRTMTPLAGNSSRGRP
jgi:hypothetical protein